MRRRATAWMRSLILIQSLCLLVILWIQSPAASQQNSKTGNLSPAHRNLIRVLEAKSAEAGVREKARPAAAFKNLVQVPRAPRKAESAGLKRIYSEPRPETSALIRKSLEMALRTRSVSPDGRDLPLLARLNSLAGKEAAKAALLAGTGEETPQPNVTEIEPNDTWPEAQNIAFGDLVSGKSTPDKDVDIFKFEGKAGDFVKIETRNQSSEGWLYAALFDPDSNAISNGFYQLNESYSADSKQFSPTIWAGGDLISKTLPADGTYHLMVISHPGQIVYLKEGVTEKTNSSAELTYLLSLIQLPTRPVSGRVIDDAGSGVAGAELYFWSYDGIGNAQAITAEEGSFKLSLPEGAYTVAVKSPPKGRYPDNQIYELFKVGEQGAELQLTLRSGVIFYGRTVDDRGNTAPYVGLSLINQEKSLYLWVSSDSIGDFSLALFPATYDIYVYPSGDYPFQPMISQMPFQADTKYEVVLYSGKILSGKVLAPDSHPLSGVSLTFYGDNEVRWAGSDVDGNYKIALSGGNYRIDVYPPEDILLPQQQAGPVDVTEDAAYDIQLVDGGILSGTVLDSRGNPVNGAGINIWPVYPSTNSVIVEKRTFLAGEEDTVEVPNLIAPYNPSSVSYSSQTWRSTDENGFWQAALLPGEYAVEVSAPGDYPYQWMKGGTYKVEQGVEVKAEQATLEYGTVFSGRVLLQDGSPFASNSFRLELSTSEKDGLVPDAPQPMIRQDQKSDAVMPIWWGNWVPTGEDGTFKVRVLPGTYDLYFDSRAGESGYPLQQVQNVNLQNDYEMTITLQAGYLLKGRVIDPNGAGMEGAYLSFFNAEGTWQGSVFSETDGLYAMRFVAGDYMMAISPTNGYFPDSTVLSLSIQGDISQDIVLRPGVRIYGRVTDKAGTGLSGVMVQFISNLKTAGDSIMKILPVDPARLLVPDKVNAGLADSPDAFVNGNGPVNGQTPSDTSSAGNGAVSDPRSSFKYIPGPDISGLDQNFYAWTDIAGNWETVVKAGIYDIYASTGYSFRAVFSSVLLQAVDCTKECEINITLGDAEIIVKGMVKDENGNPAPGALVSFYDPKTGDHAATYTDAAGNFEFNLPPGSYEVYAGENQDLSKDAVTGQLAFRNNQNLLIRFGAGVIDATAADDEGAGGGATLPKAFALAQNSPNPFNPATTISYSVSAPSTVHLTVYDLRGRLVTTLVDRMQQEGTYSVQWDGKDSRGQTLSSGVYFYRMEAGTFSSTRKMILLK